MLCWSGGVLRVGKMMVEADPVQSCSTFEIYGAQVVPASGVGVAACEPADCLPLRHGSQMSLTSR